MKEGRGGDKPSKEETRARTLEDGIAADLPKKETEPPKIQPSPMTETPADVVMGAAAEKAAMTVESSPLDDLVISVPEGFGAEYDRVKPALSPYAEAEQKKRRDDAALAKEQAEDRAQQIKTAIKEKTAEIPTVPSEQPAVNTSKVSVTMPQKAAADAAPAAGPAPEVSAPEVSASEISAPEDSVPEVPAYRMVGELFQCYVVLEMGDTMYLIDKHAAHERILFEQLKRGLRSREQSMQVLLIPLDLPLTVSERQTAEEFRDEIAAAGFAYTLTDNGAQLLQIPSFLAIQAAADAFCETVTRLSDSSGTASLTRTQRYEQALFQAACKAAIKAGRDYDTAHLKWICDRVLSDPEIRYCPHGRPVCFTMTRSAIEGRFGRT